MSNVHTYYYSYSSFLFSPLSIPFFFSFLLIAIPFMCWNQCKSVCWHLLSWSNYFCYYAQNKFLFRDNKVKPNQSGPNQTESTVKEKEKKNKMFYRHVVCMWATEIKVKKQLHLYWTVINGASFSFYQLTANLHIWLTGWRIKILNT